MPTKLAKISKEQNTKNKIFMVAARLIAEKGYNGVSMREISEQSGVSKPTIYYYFTNKESIFKELVHVGLSYITDSLVEIQTLNIPVKEKLVRLIKRHFRQCLQHPEFIKFFFSLITFIKELPFLKTFEEEAQRNQKMLTDMIQQGVDSGEFGANAKPWLAAEIIGGVLSHFFWHQLNSEKIILSDKLAEDIIEMLFLGLNE